MYAVRFGEFLFCPLWLYLVGGLWFGRVPHVWLLKPEKYRVSTGKILLLISVQLAYGQTGCKGTVFVPWESGRRVAHSFRVGPNIEGAPPFSPTLGERVGV